MLQRVQDQSLQQKSFTPQPCFFHHTQELLCIRRRTEESSAPRERKRETILPGWMNGWMINSCSRMQTGVLKPRQSAHVRGCKSYHLGCSGVGGRYGYGWMWTLGRFDLKRMDGFCLSLSLSPPFWDFFRPLSFSAGFFLFKVPVKSRTAWETLTQVPPSAEIRNK